MVHTILYSPTLGFPLNLLPLDFHSQGNLLIIAIMQEKQQIFIFEIECQLSELLKTTFPLIDSWLWRPDFPRSILTPEQVQCRSLMHNGV